MEQVTNEIRVGYSDPGINELISSVGGKEAESTRHFSHAEEFFLKLERDLRIPSFPIHHDVRIAEPAPGYVDTLRGVIEQAAELAPGALQGLTYFFDAAETLRPCFFQIFSTEESRFLYLLRMDLGVKSFGCRVVERGTNDRTPRFDTRNLFLEAVVLPLEDVVVQDGKIAAFKVRQTISQTWIGERGRGYFVQGIWMDMDLTKFFSRLFLPAEARTYPFFPFLCKYKTVCRSLIHLAPEDRRKAVPELQRAVDFLIPVMGEIQSALRDEGFREDMPFFRNLKTTVPAEWYDAWKTTRVEMYLNREEMREFRVEER